MAHLLAQVDVSRLPAPLGSPVLADLMADLMAALGEVHAEADRAPGFICRLHDGSATAVEAFGCDAAGSHGVIVNLTVWRDVESLADGTVVAVDRDDVTIVGAGALVRLEPATPR